ncbi:MAG: hypothetical protein SFU86_24050 [Pirellulaceae bacterium]|nr:hypothetical protein [Pirellulaceae bacterium]
MRQQFALFFVVFALHSANAWAEQPIKDIREIQPDLAAPAMTSADPAPGKRVRHQLPQFAGTELFHALFLPKNWERSKKYVVIFEYPGNGPYQNKLGDTNSGRLEDCNLGYGMSAGMDCIWVCLPFVNAEKEQQQLQWWGNADATVAYCKAAVKLVCEQFGGDPERLVLCGFSRGAIACNYIGLRDDEIARLWRCMVVHSHYDGVRRWPHDDADPESARQRLARLSKRPQFISHEANIDATRKYLQDSGFGRIDEQFTLVALPFPNHTDGWVLRPIAERNQLRKWLAASLGGTEPR